MKNGIIIIAIGFILLAVDIRIPIGDTYPTMDLVEELGIEVQGKIINNVIGTRPTIDIFSDILGYILLFVGAVLLLRYTKITILGMILIPYAMHLYIKIIQLPFSYDLRDLYIKALGYHFLMTFIEIFTEFCILKGVVDIIRNTQSKWNVNEMYVGWGCAMISKGVLVGIHFFLGRGILYYTYSLMLVGATIFYLNRLKVATKIKLGENI